MGLRITFRRSSRYEFKSASWPFSNNGGQEASGGEEEKNTRFLYGTSPSVRAGVRVSTVPVQTSVNPLRKSRSLKQQVRVSMRRGAGGVLTWFSG